MSYEIPQELKHREKIIFNLTLTQLFYAFIFLIPVLILFKNNSNIYLFSILSSPFIILGLGFMFFNFSEKLINILQFLKFKFSNQKMKIEDLINIDKIENNVIYTKKGKVSILEIQPINFSIRNDDDKYSIIKSFQKFLNSLDFPVQFVITTENLSIKDYLTNLKQKNDEQELYEDFSEFIKNFISEKEIRNRKFYLSILEISNIEIQTNICIDRFRNLGISSKRLNTNQLVNTMHLFFNSSNESNKTQEKFQNSLNFNIGPSFIDEKYNHLLLNDKFSRVITTSGYPRIVEQGFLDKIISTNDDFDITIHIEPLSIESTMLMLNRELQKQRADLYSEELKGSINPSLEIKFKDTRKVLDNLQKGEEKLFNISLIINCKSTSKENLDYLTKKVEAELNSIMIQPKIPIFKQFIGYQSLIPKAQNKIGETRNITTNALSAFFPLTSPFLSMEENGIFLGLNKNKIPIIRDIYNLSNANGVILATSGSGKSYFTKLLILRHLLQNTQVIVIDPQGEYVNLTNYSKGELITISRNSETIINPLDLMGHDYIEKRLSLMDMFKIMFGELSEIQKAILDKALTNTYGRKNITKNSKENTSMPILGDLYKELELLSKKANRIEKTTYQALLNRLFMFTHGVFSFMNRETNLNFKSNFVCFNIGDMPKQVKPLVMFLVLEFVYSRMKSSKERKLLVIDEAWSLLSKTEEASYIFEIVKTCRKFNLGLLLITQDVEDLLSSKAGSAVLSNSSYTLLLRQKPSIISSVVKTFNLSQVEKDYLLTSVKGRGILILENEHQEIEVVASPKENKIITTNPDELNGTVIPKKKVLLDWKITLDLEKGFYYGKVLSRGEKNLLGLNGYKVANLVPITKVKFEEVWVKTNDVESIEHTFIVHNIKEFLKPYVKTAKVNVVKDVDLLVLTNEDKQIAIEVETGIRFKYHKKRIYQKFSVISEEYDKVIIVLTNSKMKRYYERLLSDLKITIVTRVELIEYFEVKK